MKFGFVNAVVNRVLNNVPGGQISLCTILKRNGIESNIIDFNEQRDLGRISHEDFENANIEAFADCILSQKFDALSFYTMANSYHISVLMAEYVKAKSPNVIIIFAGPQASVCADETLSTFPFVDLIAVGEGELTIMPLVHAIACDDYSSCPNLVFRASDGSIIHNSVLPLIGDLDSLPEWDYSFVPYMHSFTSIPIEVGRGCPFSCKFCSTKSFWRKHYRLKSNERIISEIKRAQTLFGNKYIIMSHDSLTANKKRILSFCSDIINAQLNIKWRCSSRVDVLDDEVIDALKKSGCNDMFMGIETGSKRMQKFIGKNLDLDKALNTIGKLIKSGITVTCSFIYGFPTESEEDIADTLQLIDSIYGLGIRNIQLHRLSYLCGTEFYSDHVKELTELNLDEMSNFVTGANTKRYYELITKYPRLFSAFYNRPLEIPNAEYLQTFVSFHLNVLVSFFSNTLLLLKKKYSHSILRLYYSMYKVCKQQQSVASDYYARRFDDQMMCNILINAIKEYITSVHSDDLFVNEVFQFESDYITWFYSSAQERIGTYRYDIVQYLKNTGSEPLKRETKIMLCKEAGRAVLKYALG